MIKIAFPDMWTEYAILTIEKAGGTDYEFMAPTTSIQINEGDYPGEGIPNIAGGRLWSQGPQEDGEIVLEMYPVQAAVEDDGGLFQEWVGGTIDASEPLVSDISEAAGVDKARSRFRVSILWTNDAAATAASGTTASSTDSLRFVPQNCRITSHKLDFTEKMLKVTVTFKYPAMTRAGTVRNFSWESGDNTALVSVDTTHGAFT